MSRRPRAVPTAEEDALLLRALKFAALPGRTIAKACARYGVTPNAMRRARKRLGPVRLSLEDQLLAGMSTDRPSPAREFINYLDWLDHAVYSEEEITAMFRSLAARGLVQERPDGWVLSTDWP